MSEPQSPQELFEDPLDALLKDAMVQAACRAPHKDRRVKGLPEKESKAELNARLKISQTLANPENWEHTRTVALIHLESNTLLGNFKEWTYKYPGKQGAPRKLVRVTEPTATDGTEYVSGDWWLSPEAAERSEPQRWTEERLLCIGVTLKELDLHCPQVEVKVHLYFGGIARVELIRPARFTCPSRSTFLILQAGLDILEGMTLDSKLDLRAQLEAE